MYRIGVHIGGLVLVILMQSCAVEEQEHIFARITDSGIEFNNELNYTQELNPYTYRNYYNGAGIGIGDLDNDGLEDIYLTGNQVDNQLYKNLGNLKFERIDNSLISCSGSWSTGVSIVDINADGLMDIYVCKAGPPTGPNRSNQLFINQGDFEFIEAANAYGLDIIGFSIQASFFDFDRDGDLDCYLLNNSIRSVGAYDLKEGLRNVASDQGNKLLVNENGIFLDRSNELGIYTSEIGFGLGVNTSDINGDGWPDIYVANDFFERDYYYINQEGKGFREVGEERFSSFSHGSMGVDVSDIDHDGDQDILVVEMAPKTLARKKTKATYDSWDKYQRSVRNGYHHQFPRNILHRNQGDYFYDISRFQKIEASEWSWAPLIFDMNNDGLKDVFISNGIGKDLLDRDYLAFMANDQNIRELLHASSTEGLKKLIDIMPSEPVQNLFYLQNSDARFYEQTVLMQSMPLSFGNAAAMSDLDNDGDYDLIISNINASIDLLENKSTNRGTILTLRGDSLNLRAIGSSIIVYADGVKQSTEILNPYRGFQSTVTDKILITDVLKIDSIEVMWPTGEVESYTENLPRNNIELVKSHGNEIKRPLYVEPEPQLQIDIVDSIVYHYSPRRFNEFNKEKLLIEMSPSVDPLYIVDHESELLYMGGSQNQALRMYDLETGDFIGSPIDFEGSFRAHASDLEFLDFDNDGDMDLYVAHGSRVFSKYSVELHDLIYENLGNNRFSQRKDLITFSKAMITAAVVSGDINGDGFKDILLTDRLANDIYGESSTVYYYQNINGQEFKLICSFTQDDFGMSSSLELADLNGDGELELIVAGEWMNLTVLSVQGEELIDVSDQFDLSGFTGLWRELKLVDIDQDGDLDIIGANQGLNSIYGNDIKMYVGDFDSNGKKEQILTQSVDGLDYPIMDYDELVTQLPLIRKKLRFYRDYAQADMKVIFTEDVLSSCIVYELEELRSGIFINNQGNFEFIEFPDRVQYSSMHAIETADINQDSIVDILIGGNHYLYKPQFGRDDASRGILIMGGIEDARYQMTNSVDLGIRGEIRNISHLTEDNFLIGVTNQNIIKYKISYEE